MCRRSDLAVIAVALGLSAAGAAAAPPFRFGTPAAPEQIRAWDIDVRPDGAGLPPGRGSVAQGQQIYDAKCASCHGTFGESTDYMVLAGGVGTLQSDTPNRTTGSKLNYATTLFDYIRRAMPFQAPKSLTDDEVYALTAYVLNLNDILPADAALDRESLPQVRMPNRDGFTTEHGMMRVDGKGDVASAACMKDCPVEIRLASQIPAYARDSHGNLAEQTRPLAAVEGIDTSRPAGDPQPSGGSAVVAKSLPAAAAVTPAPPASAGAALAKSLGCTTCHGTTSAIIGPAFRDVARKYAGDAGALALLSAKVRQGGSGVFGAVPMPPQPQVKDAEARAVVQWILDGTLQ